MRQCFMLMTGTQITVVHEYGEKGEYYVTLVYHEDIKRLGADHRG